MALGSSISKTAVWVLMGLLIIGLGGFGAVNLSGNVRSVGTVGDKSIPIDQYARELSQEIRAIEAQTGQTLPFVRAQQIGLDRAVLQRLVRNRSLDHETDQLGLSVGDETLGQEILQIAAFQGIDGEFDREGYRFALQQGGLSEAEFETTLREEAARTLLQGAIVSGVKMPQAYAQTLVNYVGETRSFTWSTLTSDTLEAPIAAPTDDQLRSYYDENHDQFMLPATKVITYAWLSPDAMIDEVDVPEALLREAYDDRAAQYIQSERRLVERLAFADQEAADQATAALEVGGSTFNTLVEERGLNLADVDLGDVGLADLGAAGDQIFAAEVGDIVGPLESDLGPALFRVNGVLPAQNVSFEDAKADLQGELATAQAIRAVEARAQDLDDQLAGGATLEQLANETKMTLGTVDWTQDSSDGIAGYGDFRQEAAALALGDFPKINQLDDGGIYAMRLDEELDERPQPFEDAQDAVTAAFMADQTVQQLTAQATKLVATLGADASFEATGLDAIIEQDQNRNAFVEGTPDTFMDQVFAMAVGDVTVLPNDDSVVIVRLEAVNAAADTDANTALLAQISEQLDQTLAQDVFTIFADDVVRRAVPQVDQRALQAVHVNFP
jgi:peptidyl-prolyl cis-trans isomerase D